MAEVRYIVFFDGKCNFCNKTVDFIFKNKKPNETLYFASLESEFAAKFLKSSNISLDKLDTIYFYSEGIIYDRSTAVLHLCGLLKSGYSLLRVFKIIPRSIRDRIYKIISKNRHRIFGLTSTCRISTEEERVFFLETMEEFSRHSFIGIEKMHLESEIRIPTLAFSVFFLLILSLPYLMYERYGASMEPYPAVVLPSGAGLCKKDSSALIFDYSYLYAVNENHEWVYLNPEKFLFPMPSYYIGHIINRTRWLNEPPVKKEITGELFGWLEHKNIIRESYRENERDSFKEWLSMKLKEHKFKGDSILVESHRVKQYLIGDKIREDSVIYIEVVKLQW